MKLLSSLSEMSASEGFPIVMLGALQAFGALALIIAVLVIMDRVYKKKHPENNTENEDTTPQEDENTGENE